MPEKRIYFASDLHLGTPTYEKSLARERLFVQWLDQIKADASELFIVGDLFDFWFEYKHAVPRGFVRVLGKLAELSDAGVRIHLFTGNHDVWIFDYLPCELNATLYRNPAVFERFGQKALVGHGDGLGPGDHGYKFIKKIFTNRLCQWLFARLHPNFGVGLADYFSRTSRAHTGHKDGTYLGDENEWLLIYSKEQLAKDPSLNHLIFGHRHLPILRKIGPEATYINLGEWLNYNTFGIWDAQGFHLMRYANGNFLPEPGLQSPA